MGNILSNKSANEIEGDHSCPTWLHFGSHNEQIPKHLRPIRASRKMQKKYEQERMARSEPTKVIHEGDQKERMQRIMHLARFGGDTNEEQQEQQEQKKSNKSSEPVNCPTELALAGPGPKGAFRWYRGRRYTQLTDKLYPLPNDQTEQDRLRVLHYIFRWAFESMVLAPVTADLLKGIHVLCVGNGPGLWIGHPIVDLALDYPASQFAAIDTADLLPPDPMQQVQHKLTTDLHNTTFTPVHPALEPVSPLDGTSSCSLTVSTTDDDDSKTISPQTPSSLSPGSPRRVFENLHGHFLDVQQQRLPFPDNSFDFTMQHMASFSYRRDRWPQILDELVRVTKPGGYIQLFEIDYQSRKLGPEGKAWLFELIKHVRSKLNIEPTIARYLDKMLTAAGLVEVETRQISIPIGEWGMDMGALWQQNVEEFLRASGPVISSTMAISMEDYTRRCNRLLKELQYTKAFTNIHAAWARKPLDGHVETSWDECPPFQHDKQQH